MNALIGLANSGKIINDPVFGFINIPGGFLYDIVQHPVFQRLHRIKQLGVSSYVYPGAQHTRMQHSLGAMHLTAEAVKQLRSKGHVITPAEEEGVLAAILLHDTGHGPFSHVLEHTVIPSVSHEEISRVLMERIDAEMGGRLRTAISIFNDTYPKRFLHQLVSSQLDMDRLDYLRRDSFFTGVVEGSIGAARIIKMLNVWNDTLVVEAKGIYSIENFLVARRFMYWQVYLHKTSVAVERMLVNILRRARELMRGGLELFASPALMYFLKNDVTREEFMSGGDALESFLALDDSDIISAIKVWRSADDKVLSTLCSGFIDRRLFKAMRCDEGTEVCEDEWSRRYQEVLGVDSVLARYFFSVDTVSSKAYSPDADDRILILYNDGTIKDIATASDMLDVDVLRSRAEKRYLFYMPV
ncbi:MAG: HD domain-containing protein [bacterium]|uniref:HD domain-containing protein n=1 Tax=Candidatus Aphodosoma intestinipullorum TaxID=2840674 RepID=A0A940IE78_9BACT|nr:HD domain-containing protein [Candidatus Aphodosoma intestinipullorum]